MSFQSKSLFRFSEGCFRASGSWLSVVVVAAIACIAFVGYQFPGARHWATSALAADTHQDENKNEAPDAHAGEKPDAHAGEAPDAHAGELHPMRTREKLLRRMPGKLLTHMPEKPPSACRREVNSRS